MTPIRGSFNQQDPIDLNILSSGGGTGANAVGMGNLADELADAFSESGDEAEDDGGESQSAVDPTPQGQNIADLAQKADVDGSKSSASRHARGKGGSLNLPSPHRKSHQKKGSEYDGSEYGSDTDLDATGMPPSLIAKIDAVESLARRGNESYGGPEDDVFQRVIGGLRDLGSQSSVEAGASRYGSQFGSAPSLSLIKTTQIDNSTLCSDDTSDASNTADA